VAARTGAYASAVDHFLCSLAEHYRERAVGVVLTGSGHDGAVGIREIKAAGGFTLVQVPGEAAFDSMPRAAIATGAVDLVLPLPRELEFYADSGAPEGALYLASIQTTSPFKGARDLVCRLKENGHEVILASSAKAQEVDHYLDLLEVREIVDGWTTSADVERTKPAPDLYRSVVDDLGVRPAEAIALEDSANGIAAAKAAGLQVVAVPNALTKDMDLSAADLRLSSLAAMPLEAVLAALRRD